MISDGGTCRSSASSDLFELQFEVFGKVQRVFFRKYTKIKADELSLKGWCVNTPDGTVKGVVCGSTKALLDFKQWVSKEGSPKSRPDSWSSLDARLVIQRSTGCSSLRKSLSLRPVGRLHLWELGRLDL
mmetsp:Transcript_19759/g.42583  ORF Transcript_19759/g.42583 Transcript_19759/m.42583 type:complete len:129 (+) Transcript_19759:46-432(+)